MIALSVLREKNPELDELLLESPGYGLWSIWQGEANPVIAQTLEDYGGIEVLGQDNQALWFFFSVDAFLAVAKLGVWAQFNPLGVTMQIFEAHIKCSPKNQYRIEIAEDLWKQSIDAPAKFQIYAAADILANTKSAAMSSLPMNETATPSGFANREWRLAVVDARMAYKPQHSWYCALRPVGVHQDRNFLIGWRDFYERIEGILQRNKLRHLVHDNTLMVPLGSLRQLKQWCRDYINLIARLKGEDSGNYWPSVMAFKELKGASFNSDVVRHFELDWNSLMPDTPYLALRDAVLLGSDFEISESYLAMGKKTPESWCSVQLVGEGGKNEYALPVLAPGELIFGKHVHCFYCGQRSHTAANCPSKLLAELDTGIWNKVAACDSKSMREGVAEINKRLGEDAGSEKIEALLSANDLAGMMTRAIFGVCANLQYRAVPIFWKLRGKQYPKALRELKPEDDSPIWGVLQSMQGRDLDTLDKELETLQVRFPRDYRVYSICGFVAMERGDFKKARASWEEAHLLSHPGVMQSWHFMLLGRLAEYQGNYPEAMGFYDKMLETTPSWLEGHYRKIICMIKSGFIGKIGTHIRLLLEEDPNFFNWFMVDPEIERGSTHVLGILSEEWKRATERLGEEKISLGLMQSELHNWFTPEHEFLLQTTERIEKLIELSAVRNFVPYMMVIKGRITIDKDTKARIAHDTKHFKNRFHEFVERLALVRDEAAWFPFPRVLVEFNRNYNSCAANLNWVLKNNMHNADVFRKAQELSEKEEERIRKLEKRLKFLRVIRDGTLFALIVFRKFLLIEIIGLALILGIFPLLIYYGEKVGASWLSRVFIEEQWAIQKGAMIVVTMIAMAFSCLWTVLRFEGLREKTFEKARVEESKRAAARAVEMEKIRKQRRARRAASASSRGVRGTAVRSRE